jgi:hypothetical protein
MKSLLTLSVTALLSINAFAETQNIAICELEEKEKNVAAEDLCAELTITRRLDSKVRFDTLRNAGFSASVAAKYANADKVEGICSLPTLYLGAACIDQFFVEMEKE